MCVDSPSLTDPQIIFANVWCIALWAHDWTRDECQKLYRSQAGVYIPNEVLASALLFLRAYAVSRHNIWVAVIGSVLLAAQFGVDLLIAIAGLKPIGLFALDQIGYCIAGGGPLNNVSIAFWCFPLINSVRPFRLALTSQLIATSILIYYVRLYAKRGTTSALLRTLAREGLLYFVIVALVNAINIGFFSQTNWADSGICAPLSISCVPTMRPELTPTASPV